nr:MAG TPA: hypothetical protein [Caudoviricetes sp.]
MPQYLTCLLPVILAPSLTPGIPIHLSTYSYVHDC